MRLIKAYGTGEAAQRRLEEDSVVAFNAGPRHAAVGIRYAARCQIITRLHPLDKLARRQMIAFVAVCHVIFHTTETRRLNNQSQSGGDGPGVRVRFGDAVFRPFERAAHGTTDHETPGVGLGLALARALAEDLGGRLELVAGSGPGAAFVLTIPRAARRPSASSS